MIKDYTKRNKECRHIDLKKKNLYNKVSIQENTFFLFYNSIYKTVNYVKTHNGIYIKI